MVFLRNSLLSVATLMFAGSLFAAADNTFVGFLAPGVTVAAPLETNLSDYLLSKSVQDFGFSIYQQGLDFSLDGATTTENVSSSPALDFVRNHKKSFCSTNISAETQGLGCQPFGSNINPADSKYIELGDINFSTIADPTMYTPLVDIAAKNLIRNIINPFPDPQYLSDVMKPGFMDDGSKKEAYAKYMASQAILGVALYSMNEIYGMRVQGTALGATSDAAKATSLMAMMQDQCTKRFEQSDFAALLQAPGTDQLAVLKEIAAMDAFELWMDFQRYQQTERIEALLAAALAKMTNDSYASAQLINKISTPQQ